MWAATALQWTQSRGTLSKLVIFSFLWVGVDKSSIDFEKND